MFVGSERKIPMSRVNLLSKLQITLADHRREVADATKAWEEAATAFAVDVYERVFKEDFTNLSFEVQRPQDSSKDILRAIAMVECSVEDIITLDESTFNQWVMGEWSFRNRLAEIGMTAMALSAGLRKK